MSINDEKKRENRKRFLDDYQRYLAKKIGSKLKDGLLIQEERAVKEIREKFSKEMADIDKKSNDMARRRISVLIASRSRDDWDRAMKEWKEDREREKIFQEENDKIFDDVMEEANQMRVKRMTNQEIIESFKKRSAGIIRKGEHLFRFASVEEVDELNIPFNAKEEHIKIEISDSIKKSRTSEDRRESIASNPNSEL